MSGSYRLPRVPSHAAEGEKTYTNEDILEALRERIRTTPMQSQAYVAEDLGVTRQYIGQVLQGRRAPGPLIWEALGFELLPPLYRMKRQVPGE